MYSNAGGVVWAAGSNLVATRLDGQRRGPGDRRSVTAAGAAVPPVTVAGILGGDPESPAPAAIPDVVAEDSTPPAEVSADAQGLRIVRTKIEIGFARTATVAQVNFVLDAIGGRIVNAIAGVTVVIVRIPDPGSLAALEAVLERTRTLPAVTSATLVLIPAEEALPSSHTPPTLGLATIDHLLRGARAGGMERRGRARRVQPADRGDRGLLRQRSAQRGGRCGSARLRLLDRPLEGARLSRSGAQSWARSRP